MLVSECLRNEGDEYSVCSTEDAWEDVVHEEDDPVEGQRQPRRLGSCVHGGASSPGSQSHGLPRCHHGIHLTLSILSSSEVFVHV